MIENPEQTSPDAPVEPEVGGESKEFAKHSFIQYGAYWDRKRRSHTHFKSLKGIKLEELVPRIEAFITKLIQERCAVQPAQTSE